jgi:hypothetical protein
MHTQIHQTPQGKYLLSLIALMTAMLARANVTILAMLNLVTFSEDQN